jgi:hypothetical protein
VGRINLKYTDVAWLSFSGTDSVYTRHLNKDLFFDDFSKFKVLVGKDALV